VEAGNMGKLIFSTPIFGGLAFTVEVIKKSLVGSRKEQSVQ